MLLNGGASGATLMRLLCSLARALERQQPTMSGNQSADDVRATNIAAMGQELGELFTVLSEELQMLTWQFQELSELHGGDGRRQELMNRVAPFFFWLLQNSWWEESLLSVTRLLAPKSSGGQPNLTFQRLSGLIGDTTLKSQTESLVSAIVAQAGFATEWRNKRIAHRDLSHSLKRASAPLPSASFSDVWLVLREMAKILNGIQGRYCQSTTWYESPITHGAMTLLYTLRDGVRREEVRLERLERDGEYRAEDWDDDAPAL